MGFWELYWSEYAFWVCLTSSWPKDSHSSWPFHRECSHRMVQSIPVGRDSHGLHAVDRKCPRKHCQHLTDQIVDTRNLAVYFGDTLDSPRSGHNPHSSHHKHHYWHLTGKVRNSSFHGNYYTIISVNVGSNLALLIASNLLAIIDTNGKHEHLPPGLMDTVTRNTCAPSRQQTE